jgi:hypothetical protein
LTKKLSAGESAAKEQRRYALGLPKQSEMAECPFGASKSALVFAKFPHARTRCIGPLPRNEIMSQDYGNCSVGGMTHPFPGAGRDLRRRGPSRVRIGEKAAIHGSAKIKLIGIAIDAPKDRLTNSENFVLLDTETGQTSSDKHLRS